MKTHLVVFLFCSLECKWARLNPGALVSPAAEREVGGEHLFKETKISSFLLIKKLKTAQAKKVSMYSKSYSETRGVLQSKRKEEVMRGKRW